MTRKQAVLQAIEYLKTIDNIDDEIISHLEYISNELPLTKWTRERVIDTVNEFFLKYGWLPVASDYRDCKEHLPSITVINNLFGTKSIEKFYAQYFSDDNYRTCFSFSPYRNKNKTFFINTFKENYEYIQNKLNIDFVDTKNYIYNRKQNTPTLQTIKKALKCHTYEELLNKCNIKYNKPVSKQTLSSSVTINEREENETLKNLLNYNNNNK